MSSLKTNTIQPETRTPVEELEELKWSLSTIPSVDEVALTYTNPDTEGDLVININSEIVEPAIEDTIESHDAWMKPPKVDSDGTKVQVKMDGVPEPDFEHRGDNNIRKRGGSHLVAIPPEALEDADIELGDSVNFHSRVGEILMKNED